MLKSATITKAAKNKSGRANLRLAFAVIKTFNAPIISKTQQAKVSIKGCTANGLRVKSVKKTNGAAKIATAKKKFWVSNSILDILFK